MWRAISIHSAAVKNYRVHDTYMTSTHVVLRRNALLISSDEWGDGGVSYHVPVWLFAPDRSNHEEFDATGVTNHGSKVAQPHLKICDKQRVIDVGPYGGQYTACSRAKRRHKTHNCIKKTAACLSEAHCGHSFFNEQKGGCKQLATGG